MGADLAGEQSSEARLAGPGWTPEEEAGEMTSSDAAAQGTAFADEVPLTDELLEASRPHPGGQRLGTGRRLEQRLGLGAACPGTVGRHAASLDAIDGRARVDVRKAIRDAIDDYLAMAEDRLRRDP